MTYLVDTNVLSELRKGPRCDRHVASWLAATDDDELGLSVLVIGEIRRGIETLRRRDARGAAALERWLTRLVAEYGDRMLPIDGRVAEEWGRLTAIRAGSVVDVLIAATARVHGLTLVTRNVRDVAWTGVALLNPFEAPAAT